MIHTTRLVLDVLKPHRPGVMEFARRIAGVGEDYRVHLAVEEVDEKTETLRLEISGLSLDIEAIEAAIKSMGGSLHSVDEVVAQNIPESD